MTVAGVTVNFNDHMAPPGTAFLGLVSTTLFSRADFGTELTGLNEVFGLDNLSFAPSAIPEPSSVALLLVGALVLSGMTWLRRSERRGSQLEQATASHQVTATDRRSEREVRHDRV